MRPRSGESHKSLKEICIVYFFVSLKKPQKILDSVLIKRENHPLKIVTVCFSACSNSLEMSGI
jgi:hypothetical protein